MFAPVSAPTPPVPAPDLIAVLNQLRDTCADSAYGFASCADYSNISRHRALFRKRAQQCDAAGEQLQALVLRLGGVPVRGGPPSASLHRGWVAVHGTLCGLRDSSIVSECERGETVTRERYQRALQLELPVEVRALVEHHLRDVDTSLAQIRSLREAPCAPARHAS
jgi:uncharacterized protein (TIGR02284 family)